MLAAGRKVDRVMGWVGDLEPYIARLDKKHLWSTLPIIVVIDDGNGYRSIYAHFGKVVVKKGATVKAGQLLGYEGRTGGRPAATSTTACSVPPKSRRSRSTPRSSSA